MAEISQHQLQENSISEFQRWFHSLAFSACGVQVEIEFDFHVHSPFVPVDPLNEIIMDDIANTSCPQ